ncbi:MAG: hypothetical protein Q8P93_01380 [bacterium]|nr:hypothetical protein [bacterium]
MTIDMNDDNITSIAQLREFLKPSKRATFTSKTKRTIGYDHRRYQCFQIRSRSGRRYLKRFPSPLFDI